MIRTALELVDDQGAEALTLRSLAARLGSSTATLYRHFDGREDLARQVVEAVFKEISLDEERLAAETWDGCVSYIAEQMFAALVRHPNVAGLVLERVPDGPAARRLRDRCVAVLRANGFTDTDAARAYATVGHFVLGSPFSSVPSTAASPAANTSGRCRSPRSSATVCG